MQVVVYDATTNGIDAITATTIAERAVRVPIFWNDVECHYWFFDFKCEGHWVTGLFRGNGLPDEGNVDDFEPLHVRVHD